MEDRTPSGPPTPDPLPIPNNPWPQLKEYATRSKDPLKFEGMMAGRRGSTPVGAPPTAGSGQPPREGNSRWSRPDCRPPIIVGPVDVYLGAEPRTCRARIAGFLGRHDSNGTAALPMVPR